MADTRGICDANRRERNAVILLYIDPGAGSLLIQAVLAGMLAVPYFLRDRIRRWLKRR
jgi:hypothetical protein